MTNIERIDWRAGGVLALAAAVTLAGGRGAFGTHAPAGIATLVMLAAAVVVMLVVVARCEMPAVPRAIAMGAMILVTIACAVRGGASGGAVAGGVAAVLPDGARDPDRSAATGVPASGDPHPAARTAGAAGATVTLSGHDGAERWAADAATALSGSVAGETPGAAAWTVMGDLTRDATGAQRFAVAAAWRISGGGRSVDCGTIAIRATGERELIDALEAPLAVAVRRSASAGRAACG